MDRRMKQWALAGVALSTVVLISPLCAGPKSAMRDMLVRVKLMSPEEKSPAEVGVVLWQTDLQKAHRVSVSTNRPMLIVFGAPWCGYCKKLEKEVLSDPAVAKYINSDFVPVHLDYQRDKHIAEVLEVKSLPCTVVLNPKADLLTTIEGYVSRNEFEKSLKLAQAQDARPTKVQQAGGRK